MLNTATIPRSLIEADLVDCMVALADKVFKEDPDLTAAHANLRPFISENTAPQGAH